jgi:hypothetical protein
MPPNQPITSLLTDATVLYVCLLVGAIGLLSLGAIVTFGIYLYRGRFRRVLSDEDMWVRLVNHWVNGSGPGRQNVRHLIDAYSEQLQRRNEFWTSYGQIIVAALIIIVLTILLLTRSISAEAGLPVLSGISGFAIAKSVSVSRSSSPNDPEQRG